MVRLSAAVSKTELVQYPHMHIQKNVSLAKYSTMRLGGRARFLTDITDRSQIPEALAWAEEAEVPIKMIGGGSNIIWGDKGFPGLVLVNKIMGFETAQQSDASIFVVIGAGENWDDIVAKTVDMGYSGIEHLSLIPGTAGATPIQNVGAYGREIKDVLLSIEAYDTLTKKFVLLHSDDCEFGYRTSRFKNPQADKDRFLISAITLHLTKAGPAPPFYPALQNYLDEHGISDYTPKTIRKAVMAIRSSKLPDPAKVANNGSFFQNPIVSKTAFQKLLRKYPQMPSWPTSDDHVKLSAAWLLEQTGFKDLHDKSSGMATWEKQPLVLVNESAKKTAQLLRFRDKIIRSVKKEFGITLVQEPELVD